MTPRTQKIIKRLREELHALQVAAEVAGARITLHSKSITFQTSANQITVSGGGSSHSYYDRERVAVTLDTTSGANTLAKLEVATSNGTLPVVRRTPYSGGARWIVTAPPASEQSWSATTYTFTVQTLVDGELSAAMAWEV